MRPRIKICPHCTKSRDREDVSDCPQCKISIRLRAKTPKSWLYALKRAATKRGYEVVLEDAELLTIGRKNCFYCGEPPEYEFNGIARRISELGYVKDNCLPCCTTCNRMKSIMDDDEFLTHIRKIIAHIQSS